MRSHTTRFDIFVLISGSQSTVPYSVSYLGTLIDIIILSLFQVLNPLSLTQAATSVSSTSQQSSATHNNISHNSTNHSNHGNNLTASLQSSLQSSLRHAHSNQSSSSPVQSTPPTQSTPRLPVQSLSDGLPPNVSQLLPSK